MIKLSEQEKQLFVQNRILQDFDFETFGINKPNMDKITLKMFNDLLKLSDINNIQKWFEAAQIPNTKVEDFKERIIETKSGKVLIGIRFLGMDISKPFINIWTSFPIEKDLIEIIKKAKESFKVFQAKHIRFWSNPKSSLSIKNQKYICQNYLVGNIKEINKRALANNHQHIDLENITDLKFYDWYLEMYHKFHLEKPELKSYVTSIPKEIFEDSINQKLAYFIKYKNQKIGIIAAEKDNYFGKPSLYMNEIIISKEFRTKKLATASQRKLIELNQNEFTYIWGNIDSKNLASTKNALRLGRKIISSEILLPI